MHTTHFEPQILTLVILTCIIHKIIITKMDLVSFNPVFAV